MLGWLTGRLAAWPACGASAEDIASDVWSFLCDDDRRRLRTYDPASSRFVTYLCVVATDRYRQRRRRWSRDLPGQAVALNECEATDGQRTDLSLESGIAEVLSALTPRERCFVHKYLLGEDGWGFEEKVSASAYRKLKQRCFHKVQEFLFGD